MTGLDMDVITDAIRYMTTQDRTAVDATHELRAVEMKTAWIPYPPEIVSDWTGWTVGAVKKEFGDTVLVRHGVSGIEFQRGVSDPAQVRAEVMDIIARGRHHG